MVILNRVVNILILLAAIVAVVFSYLLFSKREKLVNGWAQMASAITVAAKTLDDGGASGTSAVRDLPEAKLKHTNADDLGQILPKLKNNISKVVTQRNDLSEAMNKASAKDALAIDGIDAKNLKSVAAYKDQERIFLTGVKSFRKHRDSISSEYSRTFSQFGANVSSRDLNDPKKYSSAINRGNLVIKDVVERKRIYSSYLIQISRAAGVSIPNVNGQAYRAELKKTETAVKKKNQEFNTTKKQLAAERKKNERLTAELKKQRDSLKSMIDQRNSRDKEIKRLNNILTGNNTKVLPKKRLSAKDPECYKYVKGSVEYIDKEYGFITINIGRKFSFDQQYGTVVNHVEFPLQTGKIMTVVRNPDSSNPLFIGKIIVTKVDDNSSVCNLVSGKSEAVQEGDAVFFTDEDIEQAVAVKPQEKK